MFIKGIKVRFLKTLLISFLCLSIYVCFYNLLLNVIVRPSSVKYFSKNNHNFVINNNLAQYSTYLIESADKYLIEANILINYKHVTENIKLDEYLCMVKMTDLQYYREVEEIIELKANQTYKVQNPFNRKLVFNLVPSDFQSFKVDSRNFNIKKILIAIVHTKDYKKELTDAILNQQFESKIFNETEELFLPYSLINYQVPSILNASVSKSVGLCVHFTYSIPKYFFEWIDLHLNFGVEEIIFYDGTLNQMMTEQINQKYPKNKKLSIYPYKINQTDLCSDSSFSEHLKYSKLNELLKKVCLRFYKSEFKSFYTLRSSHEQLTANDCLSQMKQKHEFIARYDLDEFVFPRTFNMNLSNFINCQSHTTICSQKLFDFKLGIRDSKTSSYYNYLESLIEKYNNGRDKSSLVSIIFDHAGYLNIDNSSHKFFQKLGKVLNQFDKNSTKYPLFLYMDDLTSTAKKRGHTFIIEKNDIEHAKNLHTAYGLLKSCKSMKDLNNKMETTFDRYLYFFTEIKQRAPKCIYYYKNINAIGIHYSSDHNAQSWMLRPKPSDGHFLPHFRDEPGVLTSFQLL